jgi:hypothetical protein
LAGKALDVVALLACSVAAFRLESHEQQSVELFGFLLCMLMFAGSYIPRWASIQSYGSSSHSSRRAIIPDLETLQQMPAVMREI